MIISGVGPNGEILAIQIDASGNLKVTGGGGGGGDASAANQLTEITSLQLLDDVVLAQAAATAGAKVYLVGGTDGTNARAFLVDTSGRLNVVGTITANLGTLGGAATEATLSGMSGKLPAALGTQAIGGSLSITPATSASFTVTGPLTDAQLRAAAVPVSGTITANLGTIAGVATESTQSAQSTLIGAVTETAPASDTASSGMNGRLQRIAQRVTSLIGLLPTSVGQKTMANSLAVAIASDQSALPVSAVVGQTYFEGIATITRPADTTTYAAGDAVYSSTTGAAASTVVLNIASSGTPVPAGSTVVITSIRMTSGNTGTAVLPTMDVFLKPVTFTAIGDNLAFAPAAGVTEGMAVAPVDFAKALGAGGMVAWNDGLTVRLKLDAGSSTLHFQPQIRLAYVPVSAEALRFVFSGFIQA